MSEIKAIGAVDGIPPPAPEGTVKTQKQSYVSRGMHFLGKTAVCGVAGSVADCATTVFTKWASSGVDTHLLDWTKAGLFDAPSLMGQGVLAAFFQGSRWALDLDLTTGACTRDPIVMDVVIAPVLEELLFRLILQEEVLYKGIRWSIQKSGLPLSKSTTELASKCAAIALASALFAAAHHPHDAVGFTRQWIARFGSSLLYGSLQAATDNVAVPIIAHAAHNALQYGLICK